VRAATKPVYSSPRHRINASDVLLQGLGLGSPCYCLCREVGMVKVSNICIPSVVRGVRPVYRGVTAAVVPMLCGLVGPWTLTHCKPGAVLFSAYYFCFFCRAGD
jgi:hypothetical protein